jgi:hypothetical protein
MFDTANGNGISLTGLNLVGCHATNCSTAAYSLGDSGTAGTGTTFNNVLDINIVNCQSDSNSTISIQINRASNVNISSPILETAMSIDYTLASNININNVQGSMSARGGYSDFEQFPQNSTTPSIASGRVIFQTNANTYTGISNITGGKEDKLLTILFVDANTVIQTGGNFSLSRYQYKGVGSWVTLKLKGSTWYEVSGHLARFDRYVALGTSGAIDLSYSDVWDVQVSANTSNKVTLANTKQNMESPIITIIIRSISVGTQTWGGFDTTYFLPASDVPSSVTYGTALVTKWAWLTGLNKYICLGYRLSATA